MSFQSENEASADNAAKLKTLQKCTHCGESTNTGNKYCLDCTIASKRREMCEENKKIVPNYKCRICQI